MVGDRQAGAGLGRLQAAQGEALAECIALKWEAGPVRRGVLGFRTIAQVDRPDRADAIRALLGITDASKRRDTWWTDPGERLGLDGKPVPGEAPNCA